MSNEPAPSSPPSNRRLRLALVLVGVLLTYLLAAYVFMPAWWSRYTRKHPSLEDIPTVVHTGSGIPGDPINVALVGTKAEVIQVMLAAQWYPADALSLKSSLEIAAASVLKRPDPNAPVSNLYLFGRKEDLAFEQEVGNNPRHRHHVRFWQTEKTDSDGRPIWVGAAVYDERVGLSRTTGQVTHVTAANVDTERDYLFQCLEKTGDLTEQYAVDDFHKVKEGKNGGGDPWVTDGKLYVGVINPALASGRQP